MKVLVVGSGGREHSLCWAIAKSPLCNKLYCAPGNAGISDVAECINISAEAIDDLLHFAIESKIDFVVVGPEVPLCLGLIDRLEEKNIRAFGPNAAAAELEGSKGFMKHLCSKYNIPTAQFGHFDRIDTAKEYIIRHPAPNVVKADGLAAGKGVILCQNNNEAFDAIDHMMKEEAFGDAGAKVIIEEMMEGEEVSFFALVDGEYALPLVSAQDHKRVHDGDKGPNTGGMGAYTPAPVLTPDVTETIVSTIVMPVIQAMAAEGRPYKGVLYAGIMITAEGPKLLEINVRFGDPECQPLMLRLKSDLLEALVACAEGRLDRIKLEWHDEVALLVVMAANGYPDCYKKGSIIKGLDAANSIEGVVVFHAGTQSKDGTILAIGGRVLGVTALASTVAEAQKKAYQAIDLIDWPEGFCRRDIGWRAVQRSK